MDLILSDGTVAIVDAEDFPLVSQYHWYLSGKGYVQGWVNGASVYLHRFLLGLKKGDGKEIDHCSGNKLDCRRCNLRVVSRSTNLRNRRRFSNNTSGFTGVSFDSWSNKFMAYTKVNRRFHNLGRFNTPKEAAIARQKFDAKYGLDAGCTCPGLTRLAMNV